MSATSFIDFAALKEAVSIEQAVSFLGLTMKKSGDQMRSACPICKSGGDRALAVNIAKQSYYCFPQQKGGDVIALVAHVRSVSQRDAAQLLAEYVGFGREKPTQKKPDSSPQPHGKEGLKELDYLEPEHPAVEAVGFDAETAKALGIGYAGKGIMRGTVAVPVRLPCGTLAGYIGITEAKLPSSFKLTSNIVKFPRSA